MKKIFLLLSLLSLGACTTTQNISPPAIHVPRSLSEQQTQSAILYSLTNAPTLEISSKKIKILNEALTEYGVTKQYWFYDGQDKNVVNASFKFETYYMRVKITYNNKVHRIKLKIVDSKNLKQSGDSIHRHALVFLNQLDKNIRSTLAGFDRINYHHSPNTLRKKIK
ncbi:MAG: hypothetical protein KAH18_12010 [Psychromonas sp.]|nr:hypothetical protein [Psychromonas sp.]